jgi:hypothetical protein
MSCVFALGLAALAPAQGAETAQTRAFMSFSEADRKAAQDALGWLGVYNGVVDGASGKRTLDAVSAYQQKVNAQADGILTAKLLTAMEEEAGKAKAAVGFKIIDDPATGIRIGAPTKLLEKRESGSDGAAMRSKDGAVNLYLTQTRGDLADVYKSLSADAAGRKVTYKYLKPGAFFVTAGEEGESKFYRRFAVQGDALRGFAFVYPKKRAKALDPVALAIANAFEPFPAAPTPPAPSPTPEPPKLSATALIVAPGVAVTALDPAQCKAPLIAGKPARYLEGQGALTRLGGEFGAGAAAPPLGPDGGDVVALSLSPAGGRELLETAPAQDLGGGRVLAAFTTAASGAPLFDRQARLVGFLAPISAAPRRAGVVLAAPHAILPARGLGEPGADGPALPVTEIARLRRGSVVGVFCAHEP